MKPKVKTAILGAGRKNIATDQHLPASLQSELVELVALCDRLESVNDFAREAGVKAFNDYPDMLSAEDIDMVQVCTPDQFHSEHALMALEAGKHVLLQKPPCISRDELRQLRNAAAQSKGKLKIILSQRRSPLSRSIRQHIENGLVGEVREIIIRYRGHRFPIDNPNSFYLKKESGGVWLHNALHWLDEAFFYSGVLPESCQIFTARNDDGPPEMLGEGPNYWTAVFPMGKASCLFEYNTMLMQDGMPGGMQRVIIGTEGEIRQEYGSGDLMLIKKGETAPQKLSLLDSELDGAAAAVKAFQLGIDDFAREIIDGVERAPFLNDTLDLFELLFAGLEAEDE